MPVTTVGQDNYYGVNPTVSAPTSMVNSYDEFNPTAVPKVTVYNTTGTTSSISSTTNNSSKSSFNNNNNNNNHHHHNQNHHRLQLTAWFYWDRLFLNQISKKIRKMIHLFYVLWFIFFYSYIIHLIHLFIWFSFYLIFYLIIINHDIEIISLIFRSFSIND